VAGDQFVNPSLAHLAREWQVKVIPTEQVVSQGNPDALAREIVAQAQKAFELRRDISRDIPVQKTTAVMGFSPADLNVEKIAAGLDGGKIKGIVLLAGCNNVKYTQDYEFVAMAQEFLKNDILCLAEGEAGVSLAKYGFLDPQRNGEFCGDGVKEVLASLGGNVPAVPDCNATDFLLALVDLGKKGIGDYPIAAYFAEASRSTDVAQAMWLVAMGVPVYFWPCLPVTGSPATVKALTELCGEKFGAALHVLTQKMEPKAKADIFLREIIKPAAMSGKPWQAT
jgi:carbon-monoxide dehydrogenase catalytic subunit